MKNNLIALGFFSIVFLLGCVQKSSIKVVLLKLNVSGIPDIRTVGVRGKDKPLSWKKDVALIPIVKDSLYITVISITTGYKFTEAKFTVNDEFEFPDKQNRRIVFSDKDTTIYEATYNVVQ